MFTISIGRIVKLICLGAIAVSLSVLIFSKHNNSFATVAISQKSPSQPATCNNTAKALPWLQTQDEWITDEAGERVTLRGISFCGFNNEWGERVLPDFEEKIAKVTNGTNGWYPNLLRLPIKDYHLNYFSLEEVYQALQAGVDECVEQNVYCIIDWHPVDGEKGADWRSPEMERKTREFWSYMAPRFKNHPNVLFEVYNEPGFPKAVTAENWLAWRDKAQEWVDLIRELAPRNLILIGSPLWAQIIQFAPEYPFSGDNLAYVNHTYPGMEESWPREIGRKYDWEQVFGKAADRVPIFITEFGWQADAEWEFSEGTTAEFGQPMKEFLSKRPQINWTIWTYDHYCSPRLADESDRVLGGNKMGVFVRDWLREEWQRATNPVGENCESSQTNPNVLQSNRLGCNTLS